jgi:hypothetical protein
MQRAAAELEQSFVFSASGLELLIDQESGAWRALRQTASGRKLLEAPSGAKFFSFTVGGKQSSLPPRFYPPGDTGISGFQTIGSKLQRVSHDVVDEGDAVVLRVRCQESDWIVTFEYRIPHHQTRIERQFHIGYVGPGEALLRGVEVALPAVALQPGDLLEMPALPVPPSLAADRISDGTCLRPLGILHLDPAMAAVRNPRLQTALVCWGYSESEIPAVYATADPCGLQVSFSIPLAARMREGDEVSWGSDYIWALEGDWFEVLARVQQWWEEAGVKAPADRPEWAERALIYETQIGSVLFERGRHQFSPHPDMQALLGQLDAIRGMGFEALQLIPRHPAPSYSIIDYYDPAQLYGDGLRLLVEKAHQRGLRVVLDWVTHGIVDKQVLRKLVKLVEAVPDDNYRKFGFGAALLDLAPPVIDAAPEVHPLRLQHPDWFMKFDNGSCAHTYTWALDLENRDVQDYIIEAMRYYVTEFDIDGFRVDAPTWNDFPNWDGSLPYRASRSATGGIRLFERAARILRRMKPGLAFYTEDSAPVYRRVFDMNYSYDELWMYERLLCWRQQLAVAAGAQEQFTAYQARVWMQNRRMAMPAGTISLHQVDSHDSVWFAPFPWGSRFRREQFGEEGFRALFFTLATLDGALMQYATGETGNEQFVTRVLALRREIPELRNGRCEYLKVRVSDDSVFAASWHSPSGWAVPLTNFGPSTVDVEVELPQDAFGWDANAWYRVRDVFNGKPVNSRPCAILPGPGLRQIALPLAPLESALLVVQKLSDPGGKPF